MQREAFNDALASMIVFIAILIAAGIVLSLSGCVVANPSAIDPSFQGLAAQATATRVSIVMSMTSVAATVNAANNATATAQAYEATQASVLATATTQAMETAIVQSTADQYQKSLEQIQLDNEATRERAKSEATGTAVYLAIENEVARHSRGEWFWTLLLIIFLLTLAGIGYGLSKLLYRNAVTVRDASGEVIIFRNQIFLPADTLPPPQAQRERFVTANNPNGAHGVNLYRPPAQLINLYGDLVYEFSGRQLDKLTLNIQNGDIGFRREKSGAGEGLDTLIGLSNGTLFSNILDEMKRRRYIEAQGNGHVWTQAGMIDFLGMSALPHFV